MVATIDGAALARALSADTAARVAALCDMTVHRRHDNDAAADHAIEEEA